MLVWFPSDSSSDALDEVTEFADLGCRSGALYASIFVVWVSSIGAEILLRIEPLYPVALETVLLRFGAPGELDSFRSSGCRARRVVKARARDMVGRLLG